MQPAQLTLQYTVPGDNSGSVIRYIDLARDLSAVNRRLYRQGYNYVVGKITFANATPLTVGLCSAATAGDTWMVHNAWKKGKAIWTQQRKDALELLPGISGKWSDFKVKLDDSGGTYLPCIASDAGAMVSDEWEYSEVFWDDDGTERSPTFHIIGSTDVTGSLGLVQEYHISRARGAANVPSVDADASDSIYAKMLPMQDELSDALIDDIEGDNDAPPYDQSEMAGGDDVADAPWVQGLGLSNTSAGALGHIPGFVAQCGLIKLTCAAALADGNAANSDMLVYIHLVPGPYRGVLAEPMGQ